MSPTSCNTAESCILCLIKTRHKNHKCPYLVTKRELIAPISCGYSTLELLVDIINPPLCLPPGAILQNHAYVGIINYIPTRHFYKGKMANFLFKS